MSTADKARLDWARLGRAYRGSRLALGMTQDEVARQANLDRKTISHYENGRVPGPGRIPDGYFAAAAVLKWPAGDVERHLGITPPDAPDIDSPGPAPTALELYPVVMSFARACSREGGDPRLRDAFEEAAERLLQSTAIESTRPAAYGLAAYRPHAWPEEDPGVPEDDAARIRRRLERYEQGERDN